MNLLPHLDILEMCFDFKKYSNQRKVFNALYNSSIQICLTKNYIALLENSISNKEAFEALIKELYDSNRITIVNTNQKDSIDEEFKEIAIGINDPMCIPVVNDDPLNYTTVIRSLVVVQKATPLNRDWLVLELLSNNVCNVSYQDFKSDLEIKSFFDTLFSIPRYLTNVSIFNREQTSRFLSSIKGRKIEYYTFMKAGRQNELFRKEAKKDLQKLLGGKLKLYYTTNLRKLHERKIIFESILVTIDNSESNLTVNEPTWEIIVMNNKEKAGKWKTKCTQFTEVYS